MQWLRLMIVVPLVLVGCARFNTVGWVDLMDGYTLKAMTLQVDTAIGTDITYGIVYECAPALAKKSLKEKITGKVKPRCVKVGEFGGASGSLLKSVLGGAAAGAAIGAGIAVQDFEGDAVSVEGSTQQQGQFQKQNQKVISPKRRKKY